MRETSPHRQHESEIVFWVEEAAEGGWIARAANDSIFTEADTFDELPGKIRAAVDCHFDDGQAPALIHMHTVLK